MYLSQLVAVLVCVQLSQQYAPCHNILLQGYRFQLQSLKGSQFDIITASEFVQLSMCSLIGCPADSGNGIGSNNNESRNGYALVRKNDNVCNSYTSNATGPLLTQYSLIDDKEPKKGISVSYIPTYSRTRTYRNISIVTTENQTVTYTSTNETNTLNHAHIKLYCNSETQKPTACSRTSNTTSTRNENNINFVFNIENHLYCELYAREGCPILAVNSFWRFLIDRAIVFAIVLWICALFLLVLGYLAIRVTILLYGVFTGAFFGVIFVAEGYDNFYLQSDGIFIFVVCLAVVMGLLFGITLLTVPKLGYINIGVFVAALFSLLLQNSVLYLTGSLLAFYITFGVTALVMSIISLMELRYFIIICSSFTGAFLFIRPLGFFLPGYPNELISGKNFKISVKTPWQFYLYLGSIVILTGIGIALQKCISKKVGRNKGSSGHYYLEEEGTVRDKLKKIFEFKQIKQMIKAGKKEIVQLKNMITDDKNVSFVSQDYGEDGEADGGQYIEMEKMEKMQSKAKDQQRERENRAKFVQPKSKPKRISEQLQPVEIDDSDSAEISQQERAKKDGRNKRK